MTDNICATCGHEIDTTRWEEPVFRSAKYADKVFCSRDCMEAEAASDKFVFHPDHYTAGGIEVIDFIEAKLNVMTHLTPFQAYCIGNALKYLPRAGVKDPDKFVQDIEKAVFYLNKAIGKDPR